MMDVSELAILPATQDAFTVLYEDETLLVVDKPSRLLTVPGRHPANHDCLIYRVQREWPTACVVHRLDYDTSGIVLLPLSKKGLSELSKQFQARTVSKQYIATVAGLLAQDSGDIDLPIAADQLNRPLYKICHHSGKAALTHYQVQSRDLIAKHSHVLLSPVTGRSHQLRLHLKAIGHPILGDMLYAEKDIIAQAERLLLHACRIQLKHPYTGRLLELEAPAPF